jgi:hypothetical protein
METLHYGDKDYHKPLQFIHIDHKPLQFIQTQGKLQNDYHKKWSTYLQQFHLNIKYKICISNCVTDCLSRPPVATLTAVLHSYGHETLEWPQLYQQDPDFATTYQLLGTCAIVTDFHIQDKILCHLSHLYVPAREHAKLIWEAHYSRVADHFGIEKTVVILQKHFYWPKSISNPALPVPLPSRPSRRKAYTPLCLFLRSRGSPSPWITCLVYCPPRTKMTVCLWSLIDFRRWPSS